MAGREHRHAAAAVSAHRESPTTDSTTSSTGWLELADRLAPGLPKALLAGDVVAMLPDGSRFIEV